MKNSDIVCFFFQAEDGIRDTELWLEFRRVLFRSNYYQFKCLLCHMNRHWHSCLCWWCGLKYFERIPVSTVAYNCHSMKQFSWVTCYKTAVWPMTKQSSNLTYDKTAGWPMKKQFSNLSFYKTAVAFLLYGTAVQISHL